MKLETKALVPFSRDLVYTTYRDRMPELVPYLPNIQKITVESRREEGSLIHLLNLWEAEAEIPKAAEKLIKPEMLAWYDEAVWDQSKFQCQWKIKTKLFTESVHCGGNTTFEIVDEAQTRVSIQGELQVNLASIPGVPKILSGVVKPVVEKFVVALLEPNLLKVAEGVGKFLADRK